MGPSPEDTDRGPRSQLSRHRSQPAIPSHRYRSQPGIPPRAHRSQFGIPPRAHRSRAARPARAHRSRPVSVPHAHRSRPAIRRRRRPSQRSILSRRHRSRPATLPHRLCAGLDPDGHSVRTGRHQPAAQADHADHHRRGRRHPGARPLALFPPPGSDLHAAGEPGGDRVHRHSHFLMVGGSFWIMFDLHNRMAM